MRYTLFAIVLLFALVGFTSTNGTCDPDRYENYELVEEEQHEWGTTCTYKRDTGSVIIDVEPY